jgi:NADP-dependent 3-hydroxy acid dehydrogenase YdfG
MDSVKYKSALIVGAGEGLSAALARLFAREGIRVALAARQTDKLGVLCKETGAAGLGPTDQVHRANALWSIPASDTPTR